MVELMRGLGIWDWGLGKKDWGLGKKDWGLGKKDWGLVIDDIADWVGVEVAVAVAVWSGIEGEVRVTLAGTVKTVLLSSGVVYTCDIPATPKIIKTHVKTFSLSVIGNTSPYPTVVPVTIQK